MGQETLEQKMERIQAFAKVLVAEGVTYNPMGFSDALVGPEIEDEQERLQIEIEFCGAKVAADSVNLRELKELYYTLDTAARTPGAKVMNAAHYATEAKKSLIGSIQLNPNQPSQYTELGNLFEDRKDFEGMHLLIDKLLDLENPENIAKRIGDTPAVCVAFAVSLHSGEYRMDEIRTKLYEHAIIKLTEGNVIHKDIEQVRKTLEEQRIQGHSVSAANQIGYGLVDFVPEWAHKFFQITGYQEGMKQADDKILQLAPTVSDYISRMKSLGVNVEASRAELALRKTPAVQPYAGVLTMLLK